MYVQFTFCVYGELYLKNKLYPLICRSKTGRGRNKTSYNVLPWTNRITVTPNAKNVLISSVFVFLIAFLISSLLGLSVDTTTFADLFCRLLTEWIEGNLSQKFSLITSTTLLKNSLQPVLLGELDLGFPFDDSRVGAILEYEHWASDFSFSDMVLMMAVFIWFSAVRHLISFFRDSTCLQLYEPTYQHCATFSKYICPPHPSPLATVLINTYQNPSPLFITGGNEILSKEGFTQGDNLVMSFYGLHNHYLIGFQNKCLKCLKCLHF